MELWYRGQMVGRVQVDVRDDGVYWQAECQVQTDKILRLYGLRDGCAPLRIDVAEPVGDSLRVQRVLSWHTLRTAGYAADCLPTRYVLDDGDGSGLADDQPTVTGDAKLDALIARGKVQCRSDGDGWQVYAPFAAGRECPFAFALTACTVTDGQAVLRVCAKSARVEGGSFQAGRQMVE